MNAYISVYLIASSCDVERGFSRGGLTVSKLRHALSDQSTCTETVLHSWHEFPGLIPEDNIIQVFKEKSRHPQNGSSSSLSCSSQVEGEIVSVDSDNEK